MCGIFGYISNKENCNIELFKQSGEKCSHRGPDSTKDLIIHSQNNTIFLQFHRLAINGLDEISNQPIEVHGIYLICNGEIYNYKELNSLLPSCAFSIKTKSDCEIIMHLYAHYGIEQTVRMLDGVFAFVLLDTRLTLDENGKTRSKKMFIARDPYGVRPMYMLTPKYISDKITDVPQSQFISTTYAFASELKSLISFKNILQHAEITQFSPGTYSSFIEEQTKTKKTYRHNFPSVLLSSAL